MDVRNVAELAANVEANGALTDEELAGLDDGSFGSATLGLVWDEISQARAVAHMTTTEQHLQPFGLVHGGVWCAIVESLASMGAAFQPQARGKMVVGVSNTTDFLRSHRTGRVDAVAEPVHVGRSQQLWQVTITRATDGKPVARGQVRLQNLDASVLEA